MKPRDPEAFRAEVLRRAARLERRRRRARLLVAVPGIACLLLVVALVGQIAGDGDGEPDGVVAADRPAVELRASPIDVPGLDALAVAARPDGSLWLLAEDEAGRRRLGLVRRSAWTEVADLPAGSTSTAVTSDAAGRAWLTDPARSEVHRVEEDGTTTSFPTRSAPTATGAFDLQARFWFGEPSRSTLTGLDPDGGATEVRLPAGRRPSVVGPSPGGVVAYGAEDAPVLGTLGGRVVEYPLDEPAGRVTAVAPGPGPALWYAAEVDGRARVGRLTATSSVTSHAVPGTEPVDAIGLGPDGRLWFTTGASRDVRQRSLRGASTLRVDRPLAAVSWALDTDGRLWAVDGRTGELVELLGT